MMKFLISLGLLLSVFISSFSHSLKIIASYPESSVPSGVLAVPQASASEAIEGCWGVNNGKVTFYHDNSICYDPARNLIEYQWIFEVSGDLNDAYDSYDWGSIPDNEVSPDGKHF